MADRPVERLVGHPACLLLVAAASRLFLLVALLLVALFLVAR
jgi:hypothetical protein